MKLEIRTPQNSTSEPSVNVLGLSQLTATILINNSTW